MCVCVCVKASACCRMEAVLVVQPVEDEPSIVFSACADGHVLRWELDADLNADSYRCFLLLSASHLWAHPST